jgi:tRNA U38,U39,U40 pseudouridine synthase TruA
MPNGIVKPKGPPPIKHPTICQGCSTPFESKNALFRHLRETDGVCLTGEEYDNFVQYVKKDKGRVKTIVLYGYLPSLVDRTKPLQGKITCGKDATNLLAQVLNGDDKWTRSYGCASRKTDITRQDEGTGALTELLCIKIAPLAVTEAEWVINVNSELRELLQDDEGEIRVLGRMDMPFQKFNAEMDVSHRRVEYLVPVDLLYDATTSPYQSRQDLFDSLPSFSAGYLTDEQKAAHRPQAQTLQYLHLLKKQRQLLTTHIVELDPNDTAAVMEKEFHLKKRLRQKKKKPSDEEKLKEKKRDDPAPAGNVLRRRRFHNFTPRGMAHEFLAFRRLDRFYHRATLRLHGRPFLALSLTGDLFLNGQVPRLVGLYMAITRGMIDEDIVQCIYDEDYPHLVPTPPAPSFAMFSGEASYINWEGKAKAVLTPRVVDRYPNGFNRQEVVDRTASWEAVIHEKIARAWTKEGVDGDGRLIAERMWIEEVLQPWTARAKEQLHDYRQWKAQGAATTSQEPETTLPSLDTIDQTVPKLYEKVMQCLRDADASGNWPSTTPKRQLVMVSTLSDEQAEATTSLSMAHLKAKANNKAERSSAYAYAEGDGGASGSFSVGAMPGELCVQPKGNELFPDLMKAAFELEIALCPHREPSSTIAINRNAQFRPHTDSGAGAGQSTSLIVALGSFVGGELVVEGNQHDIRFKAIEFNGWKQRHWTMPFKGERYSLVWFTPKGCEGLRGIDLCK